MKHRQIRDELKNFRGSDAGALVESLTDLKKEQFNLRFQQATGQLEKASRVKEVRKMIARTKTVLREKSPKAKV